MLDSDILNYMSKYPNHLIRLIESLRRLPGVGARTAERFAFHLLTWPKEKLVALGETLGTALDKIAFCTECGCMEAEEKCPYCQAPARDQQTLCIIHSPKDAFAIEQTHQYSGLYHVLGTLLSPVDHFNEGALPIQKIRERIQKLGIKEVIIALDSTLEADATTLFLKDELEPLTKLSRLAYGIPLGSTLDFVDGGTLSRALSGRGQL